MPTRPKKLGGRPLGATTFDAASAAAFGEVLRAERVGAGISQEDLADMAELDRTTLSKLERGWSQPTLFAILKLADALGHQAATLVEMTQAALVRSRRSSKLRKIHKD